ncbi:kinase-like domain-containing protein [Pavlovales sp. CCMP2436]|nr:kinase-like domain-containing protein [Pavlovales sp. CCMP2436]
MEAADTKQSLAEFIACSAPAGSRARCELMLAATAKRILSLVNAVHALGVVHLDIKPAHFMRFRGYWKLIDFGASCVVGSPCARPAYSEGYCAPEVAALIASGGASCDWAELAGGLGVGVGAGAGAGAGVGLHLPVRLGSGGSGGSSGAVGGVPSSGSLGGRALTLGPEVDVFSCGLVLFELFAGRRFFNPSTEPWPPRLDLGREPTLQRTASCARVGAAGCLLSDAEQCLRIVLPMLRTHPPARPPLVELLNKHLFRPAEDTVQRRQIEVLACLSSLIMVLLTVLFKNSSFNGPF